MKVSVIVPCYNVAKVIAPLMRSIESQDYEDFEVIFVNDGSKDETGAVLRTFCEKDTRYRIVEKENGGVGSARNAGLEVAQGELIFFVDGDDEIFPETISKMAGLMTEGVDIAVGAFINTDGTRIEFPEMEDRDRWLRVTMTKGGLTLWNKMFRRSIIEGNKIRFDTTTKKSEDHLFTAEYLCHSEGRIAVTNYAVYRYVENPMSASNISGTTRTFAPWIADGVHTSIKIYRLLEPKLSSGTLRELRYDTYHKYRRARHSAKKLHCTDKTFYEGLHREMRSIMPEWEMAFFAVRRRVSIIGKSLGKKIRRAIGK